MYKVLGAFRLAALKPVGDLSSVPSKAGTGESGQSARPASMRVTAGRTRGFGRLRVRASVSSLNLAQQPVVNASIGRHDLQAAFRTARRESAASFAGPMSASSSTQRRMSTMLPPGQGFLLPNGAGSPTRAMRRAGASERAGPKAKTKRNKKGRGLLS